jgi:hypothetical protein
LWVVYGHEVTKKLWNRREGLKNKKYEEAFSANPKSNDKKYTQRKTPIKHY